jgi:hypothetical protein
MLLISLPFLLEQWGNNGQVLTMQERIDSIAFIASSVFNEGEEIDNEEGTEGTETI